MCWEISFGVVLAGCGSFYEVAGRPGSSRMMLLGVLRDFLRVKGFRSESEALRLLGRKGAADTAIIRFVVDLQRRDLLPKTVHTYVTCIRTWLPLNGITLNSVKLLEGARLVRDFYQIENHTGLLRFLISDKAQTIKASQRPRLEHFNTYEDHVTLIDHNHEGSERLANVYFRRNGQMSEAWCDLDGSENCIHVDFAWKVPKVREIFEKQGLRRGKKTQRRSKIYGGMKLAILLQPLHQYAKL